MTTAPEERPAISAAIILNDGKLLLAQRKVREGSLSWQFPAGEVEPGESAEQAAVRETAEEVGLTVHAFKHLGERIHPNTGRRMAYVACDIDSGDAHVTDTEELTAVAWVAPPEVRSTSRTASHRRWKTICNLSASTAGLVSIAALLAGDVERRTTSLS